MSDFVQVSPTKSEVSLFPLCVEENWILKSQLTQGSSSKSQHCSPPLSSPCKSSSSTSSSTVYDSLPQAGARRMKEWLQITYCLLCQPTTQNLSPEKIKRTNIQSQSGSFMIVLLISAMSDRHNKTGPRAGSLLIHA